MEYGCVNVCQAFASVLSVHGVVAGYVVCQVKPSLHDAGRYNSLRGVGIGVLVTVIKGQGIT